MAADLFAHKGLRGEVCAENRTTQLESGLNGGRLFEKSYKAALIRRKRRKFVGEIVQIEQNEG
ncbi:hypothetical protein, partial [Cohnella sp.]|uniref:hypothetical protein n=1 Tax=Cohnella sp. TaxID=1883426 RepID=UPI003703982E